MKPCYNPCLFCSVKTGALVVSILEIVGGILFVCQTLRALHPEFFPYNKNVSTDIEQDDKLAPVSTQDYSSIGKNEEGSLSMYKTVLYITVLIVNVFAIVFGFLLLHAIRKESTSLMATWIIFRTVALFISMGLVTGGFFIEYSENELPAGFIGVGINCWIISVIYYHRKAVLLARDETTQSVIDEQVKPPQFV